MIWKSFLFWIAFFVSINLDAQDHICLKFDLIQVEDISKNNKLYISTGLLGESKSLDINQETRIVSISVNMTSLDTVIVIEGKNTFSSLVLHNVRDFLNDTITIQSIKLTYKRAIDSLFTREFYYKEIGGKIEEEPFKRKKNFKLCKAKKLLISFDKGFLTINGVHYEVSSDITKKSIVTSFSGSKKFLRRYPVRISGKTIRKTHKNIHHIFL